VPKSYHLDYLRFKLIKVENAKSMANPHEQGFLTRVLGLDSLELILVQLSRIMELCIINYKFINNYRRLIINSVINN
jgi:hypothetical protein